MDKKDKEKFQVVPSSDEEIVGKLNRMKAMQDARTNYELDKTDERIIQLMIEYPSITKTRLALVLGVTRKTIHARLRKPSVQRAFVDLQKSGIQLIKDVQEQGIRRLRKLIQSTDEKIALDAARFVLLPMFNQSSVTVNNVQDKIYKVQFGEGGQLYTDVQLLEEGNTQTPLDFLGGKDVVTVNE